MKHFYYSLIYLFIITYLNCVDAVTVRRKTRSKSQMNYKKPHLSQEASHVALKYYYPRYFLVHQVRRLHY